VVSLAGTPYLRFTVPYGSPVGVLKAIFKEIGAFLEKNLLFLNFNSIVNLVIVFSRPKQQAEIMVHHKAIPNAIEFDYFEHLIRRFHPSNKAYMKANELIKVLQ